MLQRRCNVFEYFLHDIKIHGTTHTSSIKLFISNTKVKSQLRYGKMPPVVSIEVFKFCKKKEFKVFIMKFENK